jgi:hypothetical protein
MGDQFVYLGPDYPEYVDDSGAALLALGPIGRINLFVGPTNAGKSRLMRYLLGCGARSSRGTYVIHPGADLTLAAERIISGLNKNQFEPGRLGLKHGSESFSAPRKAQWINEAIQIWRVGAAPAVPGGMFSPWTSAVNLLEPSPTTYGDARELMSLLKELVALPKPILEAATARHYVPALRTSQSIPALIGGEDVLEEAARINYELGPNDAATARVWTGLSLYKAIRDAHSHLKDARDGLEDLEDFLSRQFFAGRQLRLTAVDERTWGKRITVTMGARHEPNREERDLHHLGDGINALLMLLYPAFTAAKGSWIFIEEPELFLHPGLQRIFLRTLREEPLKCNRTAQDVGALR